jgi:hypothetical protein
MPRKRETARIINNFCFRNKNKLQDFVLLLETSATLIFYRDSDETVITFDFSKSKSYSPHIPVNANITISERTFNRNQIKLYPYRKNSRKFIVQSDTSISNQKILKYKIKKLGLKSFVLKREEVRIGVHGWFNREHLGKTTRRKELVLNIRDEEEFGAFYMHFSDLIQNQKYRIS